MVSMASAVFLQKSSSSVVLQCVHWATSSVLFVAIMIWALHGMQVILVERLDIATILGVPIDFSCGLLTLESGSVPLIDTP